MRQKLSILLISAAVIFILYFTAHAHFLRQKQDPTGCGVSHGRDDASSPNKQNTAFVIDKTDESEVWIESSTSKNCTLVMRTQSGYQAGQLLWSMDGSLLAFEIYNRDGHSPLTTTHARISRQDGTGMEEITLPPPNQQFSTYILQWTDSDTLLVAAMLPEKENEIHYIFNYKTQHG